MQTKTCTKCRVEQPLDNFGKDPRYKGGHTTWCNRCRAQSSSERRRRNIDKELAREKSKRALNAPKIAESQQRWKGKNRDYLRDAQKEWRDAHPGYMADRARAYRKRNPVIGKAQGKVKNAVIAGALPHVSTLACRECGKQAEQYHHWSYLEEHWLDVIPLCRSCHRRLHRRSLDSMIPVPTQ